MDAEPQATETTHPSESTGVGDLKDRFSELLEYFSYYVQAQADLVKAQARRKLLQLVLVVVAALVGAVAICSATVLLLVGISRGLAQLFSSNPWLGPFLTGVLVLAVSGGGLAVWVAKQKRMTNKRTVERYEQRKIQQRARFGHDVVARAEACRTRQ